MSGMRLGLPLRALQIGLRLLVVAILGFVVLPSVVVTVAAVITGNLEALVWPAAQGLASLVTPADLAALPRAIGRLALILALVATIVLALRKELAAVAFDLIFHADGMPHRDTLQPLTPRQEVGDVVIPEVRR